MPMEIRDYKTMALASTQLAIVQGDDGQDKIGQASDRGLNFLQRLFNTGASKKVNIEIANDFKAAMVAAYGQKVTEEVLSKTIGAKGFTGAKLSSDLVRRSIDDAEAIVKSRLDLPRGADSKLSIRAEGVKYSFADTGLGEDEMKALKEAQAQINMLNDLLMEMPTDSVALQDFSDRVSDAQGAARSLIQNDIPYLSFTGDAKKACDAAVGTLTRLIGLADRKLAEAQEVCDKNPLTYKALAEFAGKYVDSAIQAVNGLKDGGAEFGLNDAAKGEMPKIMAKLTGPNGLLKMLAAAADVESGAVDSLPKEVRDEIRKAIPEQDANSEMDICPDPRTYLGKEFDKKIAGFCVAIVKMELAKVDPSLADKFLADSFSATVSQATRGKFSEALKGANWNPITKSVTFSLEGKAFAATSVITPASHMGGAMGKLYNDGGPRGYNSLSFGEKKHAVNLAHSKFEIDVGGTPTTVFSGIRHGVHAAVDVADETEFKAANASRAKEALIAAFTSRPDLVAAAIANPDKPVDFQFTSVSLLTPDFARALSSDKHSNEKLMLRAQTEAYQSFNDKIIEVEVPVTAKDATGQDVTTMKKVKIQPHVTTFNYGVNWGGVGVLSGMFGGWGPSGDVNGSGLASLISFERKVTARLKQEAASATDPTVKTAIEKKMNAIAQLTTQILQIDQNKAYKSDGREAYKMASRIAVLTYLAGGVPAWNCKSGKDRTGMMDAECKFIATLAELGQRIPQPGEELTAEQKLLYRNILLQSGNHEMQQYNTGIAGYKLEGVGSITDRIGDTGAHRVFLGGSRIVQD